MRRTAVVLTALTMALGATSAPALAQHVHTMQLPNAKQNVFKCEPAGHPGHPIHDGLHVRGMMNHPTGAVSMTVTRSSDEPANGCAEQLGGYWKGGAK